MAKGPRASVTLQWHCDPAGYTGKAAVTFCPQHVRHGGTGRFTQHGGQFPTISRFHLGNLQAKYYPHAGHTCLLEPFTHFPGVLRTCSCDWWTPVWSAAGPPRPIVIERPQEAAQEHRVLQSDPASHHRTRQTRLWTTAEASRPGTPRTPPTTDPAQPLAACRHCWRPGVGGDEGPGPVTHVCTCRAGPRAGQLGLVQR